MLSGELSVEFALQEPEMKRSPWRWDPFWLHSEFQASRCYRVRPWLNKTKRNKRKWKEIFWECLGISKKCPISEGDSKCKEILFLKRWGHLAFFLSHVEITTVWCEVSMHLEVTDCYPVSYYFCPLPSLSFPTWIFPSVPGFALSWALK